MNIIATLNAFLELLISHMHEAIAFVLLMWGIHFINIATRMRLCYLGIIPRQPITILTGSICSPFLHADFTHLIHNSLPLFAFCSILFANGIVYASCTIMAINILSGVLIWIIGRPGIHIGASGLIMGLLGFFLYL